MQTQDPRGDEDLERLAKRLNRLKAAKHAITKVARAVNTRNYMKLTSERITELDYIK